MPVGLKHRQSTITPRLSDIQDPALQKCLNDFAKVIRDGFSNIYDDLNNVGKTKVLNFTRDLSLASGDVAYTGLGFRPRSILLIAGLDGAKASSWGFSDGTTHLDLRSEAVLAADQVGLLSTFCIDLITGAGAIQTAIVKTFDSDGFTLTWVKTGAPAGTAKIFCLAFS